MMLRELNGLRRLPPIKDTQAFPDGIGLWNIGEMNGYDVRADEHPITTKAVRELMLLTQSKLLN